VRSRILKEKRLWLPAIVLTAVLLVTACAPAPTALGEEKNVVEIGCLTPLTGPAAGAEQPGFQGILDYVRYFDEEKGIPGVNIEVVWMDMAREMGKFISGYRVLIHRGVLVIQSNDTSSLETLKSQFEKDQIPFVAGSTTGPMVYPSGWVYAAWATQGEAATAVLDYFIEDWEEERPPRLQFCVLDGAFGRGPAEEGANYAESTGFEVLPLEVFPYVVIDATPQLLRIQEREADLVYIQHIIPGAGPIMRDAERLGLQDKMQFAGTEWVVGKPLIEMAPVAVEGFLAPRALPWMDETEIPGIRTMTDTQLKYHGKVHEGPEYAGGWVYGAIMCEAVKRALDEGGYENLDGAAVERALESMRDFDVDGMVKITYGLENRRGTRDYATYKVQGGKIVRATDWREVPILVP
jgi:ABC-type branched-subunit amino acid transport system substrate-binding protein